MFVYLFSSIFFLFLVTCTFTNTLKFVVKDCDPSTGEPDDEGYEDEYVVSKLHDPHTNSPNWSQNISLQI